MKNIPWHRVPLPDPVRRAGRRGRSSYRRFIRGPVLRQLRARKAYRCLEIGPSDRQTISGFETLNIVGNWNVDYVGDASERLPFADGSFDIIYASRVREHIAWYRSDEVLSEWVRILKPAGSLEAWVPDGLKVCEALADAELNGVDRTHLDGWYPFNEDKDPCLWASTRVYTVGDGSIDNSDWHRALFTPRYLAKLMEQVGLVDVRRLDSSEVRGFDHGWINLGFAGKKP